MFNDKNLFEFLNHLAYDYKIPHWASHSVIAFSIMFSIFLVSWIFVPYQTGLFGGTLAGMFFYIGREVTDREKEGYWDYAGLISPIVSSIIIYMLLR